MTAMPKASATRDKLARGMTIALSLNALVEFQVQTLEAAADELAHIASLEPRNGDYTEAVKACADHLRKRALKIKCGGGQ